MHNLLYKSFDINNGEIVWFDINGDFVTKKELMDTMMLGTTRSVLLIGELLDEPKKKENKYILLPEF